jgi:hypothetical protein
MICEAKPTPGIVDYPLRVYQISSEGLSFVRWHVVLHKEGWAVLYSLTNKTHKLNQDITATRVYVSILPVYTSIFFSSCIIHTDSILIPTSHDLQKTTPLIPKHT